ncbi:hypothetical protein [Thiohalorhabdus denitrificans]|uniref:Uncharacterized protein n=1 Tax=Thiohalorhabdus denitrificans TaxID=381306 RepID=A0A1G5EG72_9GAMM|nr:hypothetical protein [Thiohalorhabdus denitrificans]SCY25974.1 hypothetical protein SAMN05661077_1618 [Thiohalorhabdus denitrificans]
MSASMAQNDEELRKRKRAAVRTALVLAGLALAIYVAFFLSMGLD